MAEPHLGPLYPFWTIAEQERDNIVLAVRSHEPLSGYIGGNPKAGRWVETLTEKWKEAFGVKYAIPCNSATSGLLAACMAVGIKPGDYVWTTPYSMSATTACTKVLGAKIEFIDIETGHFGIDPARLGDIDYNTLINFGIKPKAIIVTNLFGHPARLTSIRKWCDAHKVFMIEDNAQAPFATLEDTVYAGTVGDIGVFSLNVHKHIQCGEGGVIVTNDEKLGHRLQGCINHGELSPTWPYLGLNLRMTEPIAAIACAQLAKAARIIAERREIGLQLCAMVEDIPWLLPFQDKPRCKHVYYLWTALADTEDRAEAFVKRLGEHGFPMRHRYAPLLHKLFSESNSQCPVVEDVDKRIIVFEVCAHQLNPQQLETMGEIIKWVAGELDESAR